MPAVLTSPSPDADVDRRASKDLPHLSLSLESPPSSSPFPSPSSSFLPPPMPGAHEYANKLPIPVSKKKQRESAENGSAAPAPASVATAPPAAPSPMNTNIGTNGSPRVSKDKEALSRVLEHLSTTAAQAEQIPIVDRLREISSKRASLSSSRRAPPSPSVSRRASGAHTLNNVSNNNSVSLSRAPSNATTVRRRSRAIKVRDFAYPSSDLRHTGQGPDAPRPGRSRAASEYDEDMLNGNSSSRRNSGWGAFRWAGSKLWGFALGGGNGKQRTGSAGGEGDVEEFVPTSSDFARNFDVSSPHEEYPPSGFHLEQDRDEYEDEDELEGEDGYPDQDVPLLPGLYRAMYAFVPEGTAEMALAEDQIVRVIGRGGGVGWAVAEGEDGSHALVPESYLEAVQLDESPVDSR